MNDEVRPIYQRFADEYGPFLNQVKIFAHRPVALKHIMGMLMEMADNPILNKRHLEIAIVAVSAVNRCDYCIAHHAPRLFELGLSAKQLATFLIQTAQSLMTLIGWYVTMRFRSQGTIIVSLMIYSTG